MLVIACNSREVIEAEPCEPQYSPILDKVVAAGLLEVRAVGEGGRMGARVPDPDGNPLWVSVDTEPTDLRYVLPGPGRYAVIARDHRGRHLGRNDVFARESGQPDPFRAPTAHERLQDELARERERRAAAEKAMEAEQKRRLEAQEQARTLVGSLDKANRLIEDLGGSKPAQGRSIGNVDGDERQSARCPAPRRLWRTPRSARPRRPRPGSRRRI